MSVHDLIVQRVFKCSKRQLFDAWSQANLMSKWFFASPQKVRDSQVISDFRVGGEWQVIMYFADGDTANLNGIYKKINRYSEISFSWNSSIATDGLVRLFFKEISPNRTELKLVHSNFVSDESRLLHNKGWSGCLGNLEVWVSSLHLD